MRTEIVRSPRRGVNRAVVIGLCGLAWLAAIAAGCPGTLENKDRFLTGGTSGGGTGGSGPMDCPDVPSKIFTPKCGGSGCHGPMNPSFELDLESPNVADRVVGKPALECTGILADPQDAEGSVLYTKLLETPPCGGRMPLFRDPLSEAEIACVKGWIEEQSLPMTTSASGTGGGGGAGGAGGAG